MPDVPTFVVSGRPVVGSMPIWGLHHRPRLAAGGERRRQDVDARRRRKFRERRELAVDQRVVGRRHGLAACGDLDDPRRRRPARHLAGVDAVHGTAAGASAIASDDQSDGTAEISVLVAVPYVTPLADSPPASEPLLRARNTTNPFAFTEGWLKLLNVSALPGIRSALLAIVRHVNGVCAWTAPAAMAATRASTRCFLMIELPILGVLRGVAQVLCRLGPVRMAASRHRYDGETRLLRTHRRVLAMGCIARPDAVRANAETVRRGTAYRGRQRATPRDRASGAGNRTTRRRSRRGNCGRE